MRFIPPYESGGSLRNGTMVVRSSKMAGYGKSRGGSTGGASRHRCTACRACGAEAVGVERLAFVVVTYNTRELLRKCLASIMAECSSLPGLLANRTIVVDNASSDGTVGMVSDEFPTVRLIASSENLGPAKGFNLGLAEALKGAEAADVVAVMNSDVVILPGTIRKMLEFLRAHPRVDGVSVPLFYPDMAPQKTRTHIMRILPLDKTRPFREDFPGTTFAMIRARAFRRVGGYDENYYFYNEDLDWAQRAKRRGCVFYHLPEAGAIHALGQGRKQNVSAIVAELYRSNIYYYKRYYPGLAWLAHLLLRLEMAIHIRRLCRERLEVADRVNRESLEKSIRVYKEARRRMDEEYRIQTEPRIPSFGE